MVHPIKSIKNIHRQLFLQTESQLLMKPMGYLLQIIKKVILVKISNNFYDINFVKEHVYAVIQIMMYFTGGNGPSALNPHHNTLPSNISSSSINGGSTNKNNLLSVHNTSGNSLGRSGLLHATSNGSWASSGNHR